MTPLDLAKAFVAKGREDESLLVAGLEDERISDAIFGFHAQQAVEKYLKAVLATDQEKPERTHDLDVLIEQCRRSGHAYPEDLREVADLSRYAVQERYPLAVTPPIDRVEAIKQVVAVREWAHKEIAEST
ncbi:MAG TPA: HEPN domain-containing protein [Actinomycetota bacterium]|nr:HEPN domain-containing protein [Actinomycetota bacterium]